MRLIDADTLRGHVEALLSHIKRVASAYECGEEAALLTVMQMIAAAPTVSGWISVEDRLPMLIELVLFTGKNAHGGPFLTQRGYFDGTFWHSDSIGTVYATTPVTHWMPLPEPPEVP